MRLEKILEESLAAQGWRVAQTQKGKQGRKPALLVTLEPTRKLVL